MAYRIGVVAGEWQSTQKVWSWQVAQASALVRTVQQQRKAWFSFAAYAVAIPMAFVAEWFTMVTYFVVAAVWLLPDKHLEVAAED